MANLMDSELTQLLRECELTEQVITWMRDTCEIRNVRHLAHWCSQIGEVETAIFEKLPMNNPSHMVLANLRAVWTAASAKNKFYEGNRALAIAV